MALQTTYTVTAKKHGRMVFKFDLNGDLIHFNYEGELFNQEQREWFYARMPYNENRMKNWQAIKEFTVVKGEPDISFENFYKTYNKKQKKERAKKLFNKLSKDDKFNAIAGIKKYNNWLRLNNGIAKCLPDTYLYNRRWDDDS